MDVETALLLGGAFVISILVAIQHFYDRFHPKGLYLRSTRMAATMPTQIGIEVENALERVQARLIANAEAEAKSLETSAKMSMVRSVGVDKAMQATVSKALSEAILGPALPILRHFAPGLADTLEENPQLVDVIMQNPLFKKYIEPRIAQYLGSKSEGGEASVGGIGFGT